MKVQPVVNLPTPTVKQRPIKWCKRCSRKHGGPCQMMATLNTDENGSLTIRWRHPNKEELEASDE